MAALAFCLKYWREIALTILVLIIIVACAWIASVFKERDRLRQENQVLTVQLEDAAAMQQFSNRVTEAIGQIRIRSNVNVSKIENAPAPEFLDSQPLPFIPGGVLGAHGLYSSATAGRADAGAERGPALPAREPGGAVLPDRPRAP